MPQARKILRYRQLPLPEDNALQCDLKPQAAGVFAGFRQPAEVRRKALRYPGARGKAVPSCVEIPVQGTRGVQHQQEIDIGVSPGAPPGLRAEEHYALQVRLKLVEDGVEGQGPPCRVLDRAAAGETPVPARLRARGRIPSSTTCVTWQRVPSAPYAAPRVCGSVSCSYVPYASIMIASARQRGHADFPRAAFHIGKKVGLRGNLLASFREKRAAKAP